MEPSDLPERPTRDLGYRADARLRSNDGGRTRLAVFVLVAVVGAGVAFSVVDRDHGPAGLAATPNPLEDVANGPTDSPPAPGGPSALPILEILAQPAPARPVPINAGWLRWLDPVAGSLGGAAKGPEVGGSIRTFVDAGGRAVQVCVGPAQFAGGGVRFEVRMCAFDGHGGAVEPQTIGVFTAPLFFEPWDESPDSGPFQLDATVSPDGRTLWVVTSVRTEAAWSVDVRRVDIPSGRVVASRALRSAPVLLTGTERPSPEGWLVPGGASLRPVVRVSPEGDRLSVTLTAAQLGGDAAPQQERLVLDSSLDPSSPIDVAWPASASADPSCDPARAAWATETDFVSLCAEPQSSDAIQAFVRVQDAQAVFHDVDIGPATTVDRSVDDSSWLLDGAKGILYRWEPSTRTLSILDVATREGTDRVLGLDENPKPSGAVPTPLTLVHGGRLAWTHLAPAGSTEAGLQMAGSGDGRYLYLIARQAAPINGNASPVATQWVFDTSTGEVVGRGAAPGPVDQIALAPGGGPLVEMATPVEAAQSTSSGGEAPPSEWTTPVWFVDPTTGQALEMIGRVSGPAGLPGYVMSPTIGTLWAAFDF